MKLLLDTHVWLWWLSEPIRLSPIIQEAIANRENQLFLSVASIWEIGIKVANEKLSVPQPLSKLITNELVNDGVVTLDIKTIHALQASQLPYHHKDPFDRMIIAQAQVESLSVITADRVFQKYDVSIL